MRNGSGSGPRDAEQPRVNNTVHSSQQAMTNAFPLSSFIATGHHKRIPPVVHSSQQAITNAFPPAVIHRNRPSQTHFPLPSFIATGRHERIPPSRHSSQQAATNATSSRHSSQIATGHHKRIPPCRHSSQQAITNAFLPPVIPAWAGIWMRDPRTILRTHPVTLRGLGYFHEYIVGRRTGDSRLSPE